MLAKACKSREDNIVYADNWTDFMKAINERKQVMAPWCNTQESEIEIKEKSKEESLAALEKQKEEGNEEEALLTGSVKTLCIPID